MENTSVESLVFFALSPVTATLTRILRQAQDEQHVERGERIFQRPHLSRTLSGP
ncbi:MAG: hypothetical protein ABFS30_14275 [Pseudomonadota bacterium]